MAIINRTHNPIDADYSGQGNLSEKARLKYILEDCEENYENISLRITGKNQTIDIPFTRGIYDKVLELYTSGGLLPEGWEICYHGGKDLYCSNCKKDFSTDDGRYVGELCPECGQGQLVNKPIPWDNGLANVAYSGACFDIEEDADHRFITNQELNKYSQLKDTRLCFDFDQTSGDITNFRQKWRSPNGEYLDIDAKDLFGEIYRAKSSLNINPYTELINNGSSDHQNDSYVTENDYILLKNKVPEIYPVYDSKGSITSYLAKVYVQLRPEEERVFETNYLPIVTFSKEQLNDSAGAVTTRIAETKYDINGCRGRKAWVQFALNASEMTAIPQIQLIKVNDEILPVQKPTNLQVNKQYNGSRQTNGYTAAKGVIVSGSSFGLTCGTYICTYSLKPGYVWNDQTTDPVTVTLTITLGSVEIPQILIGSLTYDQGYQSPLISEYNNNLVQQSGVYYASNADTYTLTWSLLDSDNSQWSDGTKTAKTGDWTISPMNFSEIVQISGIQDQEYTGSAICPKPQVTVNGRVLTNDLDYTLSYSDNINVGVAIITVTGIGNYSGIKQKTFNIVKCSIEDAEVVLGNTLVYNGAEQTMNVDHVLVNGILATFVVTNNVQALAGEYYLTCTGTGNFTGSIRWPWSIARKNITNSTIVLDHSSLVYNSLTQSINIESVKIDSLSVDYDIISGDSGIHVGEYTLKIKGINNFDGEASKQWNITTRVLDIPYLTDYEKVWNGQNQGPTIHDYNATYETQLGTNVASDVGGYSIIWTLSSPTDSVWEDGSIENKTESWAIARARVGARPDYSVPAKYTGDEISNGYTPSQYEIVSGETSGTNIGDYVAYYTLDSQHAWSDGTTARGSIVLNIYSEIKPKDNTYQTYSRVVSTSSSYESLTGSIDIEYTDDHSKIQLPITTDSYGNIYDPTKPGVRLDNNRQITINCQHDYTLTINPGTAEEKTIHRNVSEIYLNNQLVGSMQYTFTPTTNIYLTSSITQAATVIYLTST